MVILRAWVARNSYAQFRQGANSCLNGFQQSALICINHRPDIIDVGPVQDTLSILMDMPCKFIYSVILSRQVGQFGGFIVQGQGQVIMMLPTLSVEQCQSLQNISKAFGIGC